MRATKSTVILMIILITSLILLTISYVTVKGNGKGDVDFIPMKASAYTYKGNTELGGIAHRGIAAARPEWVGFTAMVYEDENGQAGEFLGYYEIKDSKWGRNVENGEEIKLWVETPEECLEFGKKDVLIVLRRGVG